MDTYQPIYDAVRSRLSNGDIGQAVNEAITLQAGGLSYAIQTLQQEYSITAYEARRPSVLFRPSLNMDGDQWCALYGDNPQDGVAGFGPSPAAAMEAFDNAWLTPISSGRLMNERINNK